MLREDLGYPASLFVVSDSEVHESNYELRWALTRAGPVSRGTIIPLEILHQGEPSDLTRVVTGHFLLGTTAMASALERVAGEDVELFRTTIDGKDLGYEVIHLRRRIHCLDYTQADAKDEDPYVNPIIDPSKCGDHKLFRDVGSLIIATEEIVRATAVVGTRGYRFVEMERTP